MSIPRLDLTTPRDQNDVPPVPIQPRDVMPDAVQTIVEHLDFYSVLSIDQQRERRREFAARMVGAILALTKGHP